MSQISRPIQNGSGGGGTLIQQRFALVNTPVFVDNSAVTPMVYGNVTPQITQGAELMTLTITPTDANNLLYIRFESSAGGGETTGTVALFQDATVNALAARSVNTQLEGSSIILTHIMTAGTLALTTFRIRYGVDSSGTGDVTAVNGDPNLVAALYGGVSNMVMYIYEIQP